MATAVLVRVTTTTTAPEAPKVAPAEATTENGCVLVPPVGTDSVLVTDPSVTAMTSSLSTGQLMAAGTAVFGTDTGCDGVTGATAAVGELEVPGGVGGTLSATPVLALG
jgi:hypothetical protein